MLLKKQLHDDSMSTISLYCTGTHCYNEVRPTFLESRCKSGTAQSIGLVSLLTRVRCCMESVKMEKTQRTWGANFRGNHDITLAA